MTKNKSQSGLLLPLILIEVYLIATLLLLVFGPIVWSLENEPAFWLFIAAYHVCFIFGYLLAVKKAPAHSYGETAKALFGGEKLRLFWLFLAFSFVASLIGYRNLVHSRSYIPFDFFPDFFEGLIHPARQYYGKMSEEAMENFSGNTTVTAFFAVISIFKFCLIPLLVFFWTKLSKPQKIAGLIIAFISFAAGVTVGTNKPIFDTLFLFAGSLFVEFISKLEKDKYKTLRDRKTIVAIIVFLVAFCPIYFLHSIKDRVGTVDYIETTAPSGGIKIKESYLKDGEYSRFTSLLIAVDGYIDQGYLGMSLALDEPFETTYGIGHSHFLLNAFRNYLGIDLFPRTYQRKITKEWAELGQWHSFYSQAANDVSFYGVMPLMFVLGAFLALVWKDAVASDNLIGKSLLIMFIIMFLYMPANNQVFNILETLFTFWELTLLWTVLRFIGRSNRER